MYVRVEKFKANTSPADRRVRRAIANSNATIKKIVNSNVNIADNRAVTKKLNAIQRKITKSNQLLKYMLS